MQKICQVKVWAFRFVVELRITSCTRYCEKVEKIAVVMDVSDGQGNNHEVGEGVSLRPNPDNFVYVLSETTESAGDGNLLYDTILSMLDTTLYTVKRIKMADVVKGNGYGTGIVGLVVF